MRHRCPICKTPTDSAVHADFPFCSERCRLLDLGNWAAERYVISEPAFDMGDRKAVNEMVDRKEVNDTELNETPNPNESER